MSIVTKTGDLGTTGLMFNRRVSKSHPRVEACGSVDELNAALGLARASAEHPFIREHLLAIQKNLVILMGELATVVEDLPRLLHAGFSVVTPQLTATLDDLVKQLEAQDISPKDWAMPGATVSSAALDFARTTCRQAERRVCALQESGELSNPEIIVYLNRLSDTLWLLARWVEAQTAAKSPPYA
jgi:cob(I)alamin adenosyltransferase